MTEGEEMVQQAEEMLQDIRSMKRKMAALVMKSNRTPKQQAELDLLESTVEQLEQDLKSMGF